MLIGSNITKSFTGETIFENISFRIGNNRKVALVGKNGCGKSTLFNLILGNLEYEEGNIRSDGETIGHIPQEFSFPDELVGEYLEKKLENSWDFYKIDQLVEQLEFNNFDIYQEINTMSEGQKMKLKILETLLSDPTMLLIDEPTNHLDIEGIMWFERYVKNLDKTVLMISHDREFLNNTVDEIWEIDKKKIFVFIGDFDNYKQEKLKLIDKWNEEYVRFLKKKKQLEVLLDNVRKIKDGKKRGTAVSSAKKRMEREVGGENKKEEYVIKKMNKVNFETGVTHSKLMVRFDEVQKKYQDKSVFENMSFEIRGGQKVWLLGPNGAGKSTIVKIILGFEPISSGEVKIGENLRVGYFAQKHTNLDYTQTVHDLFVKETQCFYYDAIGLLSKFMFEKGDLVKKVGNLSPGQRARFAFAIFANKDYDMLILDEPDNHLDIDTKEVLEESLNKYKGTLILISHDRFFVERVGIDNIMYLKDGEIVKQ